MTAESRQQQQLRTATRRAWPAWLLVAAVLAVGCARGSESPGSGDAAWADAAGDGKAGDGALADRRADRDATIEAGVADIGPWDSDGPTPDRTNLPDGGTGPDHTNSDRVPLPDRTPLPDRRTPLDGPRPPSITIVVGGDIVEAGRTSYARASAALVASHAPAVSAVVLSGDNARWTPLSLMTLFQYYNNYYRPAAEGNWGQFDAIAFPQAGNHEYFVGDARGYFDYFATRMAAIRALPSYHGHIENERKGYYSFDLGGWHVVSLNSNCHFVSGGCAAGSQQESWLRADLASHASMPLIAVWHAPRYACGGSHGDDQEMQAFWADLYDAGADFVFTGHEHFYQRWKPLDKDTPAKLDTARGLTQIIAGSTGVSTYAVCSPADSRVAKQLGGDASMGTLFLTLGADGSYSFEYRLITDWSVFDSGSGRSHNAR